MESDKNSYKSIFKATAILGSVQVFNIIIGVVRNKIVSVLLGPAGIGILGLFQSTSQTVSGFTNCGISGSAVKNISQAYEKNDLTLLGEIIYIFKRLVAGTGTLATLIMLVLCRKLSQWSFGNDDFTISFACLSISLLFTQATQAYITIIQGCRRINYYARANILGNLCSLIISIPLYYIWGKDAIVPVLILLSVSTFLFAYLYEKKIGIKETPATKEEFKGISYDILRMGIPLAVSEIFPILASYLIRLYVSNKGGVAEIGYFSAGFTILNGYVGMIFTAMASDYIPRLSAIVDDNKKCETTINNQIELSLLIVFPILIFLFLTGTYVVKILYTDAFMPMLGMVYWGSIGMIYKTLNWCYGCVLVPKRESKAYFVFAVLSAIIYGGASILLYSFFGVSGLGMAILLSHAFDFSVAYLYISKKYNIKLHSSIFIHSIIFSILLLIMVLINTIIYYKWDRYIVESIVLVGACVYSIYRLNQLMDLKTVIKSKLNRK